MTATPIVDYTALYNCPDLYASVDPSSVFTLFQKDEQGRYVQFTCDQLRTILLDHANVNETDRFGLNLVQRCIVEEMSYRLNDDDAHADQEDREFRSILQFVLDTTHFDLNHQDEQKRTVLHHCMQEDQFDLAQYFLDKGVDKTLQDVDGRTALDYVVDFKPSHMSDGYRLARERMISSLSSV